jgi:hypothetical protein
LKKRLDKALGLEGAINLRTKAEDVEVSDTFKEDDLKVFSKASTATEDEDLDYFKSLAESD